jgi:hypothetical protein
MARRCEHEEQRLKPPPARGFLQESSLALLYFHCPLVEFGHHSRGLQPTGKLLL